MKSVIPFFVLALMTGCAGNSRPAEAPNQSNTSTTSAAYNNQGNTASGALEAGPTPAPDTQGGRPQEQPGPQEAVTTFDGSDQAATSSDFRLTQQIRHDLMGDPSLSFMAKNVTIVTNNGRVMLLGFVKNEQERQTVSGIAKQFAGGGSVDDRTRIQPADPMKAP